MPLSPEALEQQEKEALQEWASSKYAEFEPRWATWALYPALECDSDNKRLREEGTPFLTGDPGLIAPTYKDTFIVSDVALESVFEVTRDYQIQWETEFDSPGPRGVDLNPWTKRVITGEGATNDVVELDRKGNIVNRLGAGDWAVGTIGNIWGARWHDDETFWIVDRANHVVGRTNWAGDDLEHIGEYGVSGTDAGHLNDPWHSDGYRKPNGRTVLAIADSGNNRIERFSGPVPVSGADRDYSYAFPQPGNVFHGRDHKLYAISRGIPAPPATVVLTGAGTDAGDNYFSSVLPFKTNQLVPEPTFRRKAVITYSISVFEVDLNKLESAVSGKPVNHRFLDSHTISANATWTSIPFYLYGARSVTFYALSTQSATLRIRVYKEGTGEERGSGICPVEGSDEDYDSVSLTANSLETYNLNTTFGCHKLAVDMGGTEGDVDLWMQARW